jgi:hypothetical protein
MKPKVSRRDLLRRLAEGRRAMSHLAALVSEMGGSYVLKRETYQRLHPGTGIRVKELANGDIQIDVVSPSHGKE